MMGCSSALALVCLVLTVLLRDILACSTVVVGRKASATGAVMASHSNDGDGCFCHSSVNRVLAKDWPPNATRDVKGHPIPQVPHTYAYHTEGYAAMNEHQVGLAESTCSGRKFPATGAPSTAFMDIVQLGQLALERANTSRMAVQVMGQLAEKWGYADATESLLVIDPREAFVFQIMQDDTRNSSVWVAQRVPDDHVGSVTNGLTVREVDFADKDNFLFSTTMRDVALRQKLWRDGEPFDFTKVFGAGGIGEAPLGPQYYVSRRMWVAYKRLAPEADFGNGVMGDFIMDAPLPATVKVRQGSVRLQDVMNVMRDYYEGTPYDMTVGMAAGPSGSPDRFGGCKDCGALNETVTGSWERTIATHHSIVSLVMEARSWLPDPIGGTLWFAPHAAHTSVYAPFPCGMDILPASYANGSGWSPSNNFTAALANRAVFGAVQSRFREAILQLNATRGKLDNGSLALQASTDAAYAAGTLSMDAIGALFRQNADSIVSSWWDLHNELMATQNQDSGYPAWWLKSPDVRYTRPLEGSTAGQSTGAESATAADSCVHPEVVDELRAKVAELERKLRDLQPHAGGHENYVLE